VHAGGIERVVAVADPQKARALLEGFGPTAARPSASCASGRRRSYRVKHDALRKAGADAGHARQQGRRGGVDVDATALTQSSTTASRDFVSFVSHQICWYWPTPIDFGRSSQLASGILQRRAIETGRAGSRRARQLLRGEGAGE